MIPDLSFTIGSLRITPFFWGIILAGFLSSFSIWRRLKEDYPEEVIFSLTLLALAGAVLFSRLLFVILNFGQFGFSAENWFFLNYKANFSLAGAGIGAVLAAVRPMGLKSNPWEVLDSLTLPFLYFFLLGGLGSFLTKGNFFHLVYFGLGISGLLAFPWLKKSYRSFFWYKSGKTGFLFSLYSLFICLFLLVLAFCKNDTLYLSRLVWLILVLGSLATLYFRSERNLKEDIQSLVARRQK